MKGAAFRFCFLYFTLYSLLTQIVGGLIISPFFSFPALGVRWPMRGVTLWLATDVLHITSDLSYTGNSGDTAFHWTLTFLLLVLAILGTAIWSAVDRERSSYPTVYKWFRVFIRFALASQMFYYGMAKVIPTQFPSPSLVTLVEPVGNLSLTGMLWTAIGASRAYQMFTGWAEVLAGVLLVFPRTAMLGALVCLADMAQVFVLNMTYDIGLKLISFHLILMTLFYLAPDLSRLARFILLNRGVEPSTEPELFRAARANRAALTAQMIFGAYLLGMFTSIGVARWRADGGGSPRSPLYGIWNINQLVIDGEARPAVLNDYDRRWRRVILDEPSRIVFQRTDDSFARYGASIDVEHQTLELTKGNSPNWQARFKYMRPADERLTLAGEMDGYQITMELERVEFDTFRLLNSGFRWIRPPDLIP
jgi:hypothetical protein